MEFLGNLVNSLEMTISVTPEKRAELNTELMKWVQKKHTSRRELESLIGKLQFAGNCVRPGRLFVSRLLKLLKGMKRNRTYQVTKMAQKDIRWWLQYMKHYSGVSILWMDHVPTPDRILASDACLPAAGGNINDQVFVVKLPKHIRHNSQIVHLEGWPLIITLKVWGPKLKGKT